MPLSKYVNKGLVIAIIGMLSGCSSVGTIVQSSPEAGVQNTSSNGEDLLAVPAVDLFKQTRKKLTSEQLKKLADVEQAIAGDSQPKDMIKAIESMDNYLDSENGAAPSILWLALGDAYMAADRLKEAENSWLKAVSVNDNNYFAHDRLGQYYRAYGQFTLAEQHYDKALVAWPDFANGYRHRGILKDLYLGRKEAALADYLKLKQLLVQKGADSKQVREIDRWIKEMQRAIEQG
jgi:tetratricopeptide (TPR) repeat protein